MKASPRLIFVLLAASVSLNLYLLFPSEPDIRPTHSAPATIQLEQPRGFTPAVETLPDSSQEKLSPHAALEVSTNSVNREQLLTQANTWLQDKHLVQLESFLQKYLKQHPQDMDFLLLEAHLKVETELLSDAISHYYDLLRMPMTAKQHLEIKQQIKALTSNTIDQLSNNYSWDILARFVEPLFQLEPTNRQYILSLATAYAELFQAGLMENVLASLRFDDPSAQKIRQILSRQQANNIMDQAESISAPNTQDTRPIPLKKIGDHYMVQASLSSNPVTLLIDTGASITAISRDYFRHLSNRYKINFLGRFNINTAGGRVMAPMYQFQELTIQHVKVENLAVVVIPMQGMEQADGLLGMNFLREFDFKLDQGQSVLFLN